MSRFPRLPAAVVGSLLIATGCTAPPPEASPSRWTALDSGTDADLRGLSVVSAEVVWTSGSQGVVLRSTDGGATWTKRLVEACMWQRMLIVTVEFGWPLRRA